jgi:DNA-directed RNA polymerase sigma subunit (sigma70/sigma32)
MAGIGAMLRAIRQQWGLFLRQVERRSRSIARERGDPSFKVSASWLVRLESDGHELTVNKVMTAEQERVMTEHLPIVRLVARRIHERLPQHVPIEDLYSAGVLGLLDAFGRFDPSKQVLFRTYAQYRIRGAILDSLRTLDWSPRELRRKGRAIEGQCSY